MLNSDDCTVSSRASRLWNNVFAAEDDSPRGRPTLEFQIRRSGRVVARVLQVTCVFGYGLIDVAALIGPGLEVLPRVGFVVVATIGGLLQFIFLERRLVRAKVTATPEGLYVFNGFRRHFVPWAEVEGFEHSSRPFLLAIKRSNGTPLPMAGLTPGSFGRRGPQKEDLESLKRYWREHATPAQ